MKKCSKCNADNMSNVCLSLLVSSCSHYICSLCVKELAGDGKMLSCPNADCNVELSRKSMSAVTSGVPIDRELKVRMNLSKIFNRRRGDFDCDLEFLEYQEMAEEIAFNRVNKLDKENTDQKVGTYKRKWGDAKIQERNLEISDQDSKWKKQMEKERKELEERELLYQQEREEAKQERRLERERLLKHLQQGKIDAEELERRVKTGESKRKKRKLRQELKQKEEIQKQTEQQVANDKRAAAAAIMSGIMLPQPVQQKAMQQNMSGLFQVKEAEQVVSRSLKMDKGGWLQLQQDSKAAGFLPSMIKEKCSQIILKNLSNFL